MQIIIEQELQNLLKPLSVDERETLKQSLKDDGQREPILLWNRSQGEGVIVDGHQRYSILKELGIVPKTRVVMEVTTLDQAKLYMLVLQLGRRNITDDIRKALAADLYEVRSRIARMDSASTREARESQSTEGHNDLGVSNPTRVQVAKETGLSEGQVRRALERKHKDPALHEKVRSGEITQREQSRRIKQDKPARGDVANALTVDLMTPKPLDESYWKRLIEQKDREIEALKKPTPEEFQLQKLRVDLQAERAKVMALQGLVKIALGEHGYSFLTSEDKDLYERLMS